MARSLSPFTRLTLLVSELNNTKLENLLDPTKCDLLHNTGKLFEDIEDPAQRESAVQIGEQGKTLFALLKEGNLAQAEIERRALVASCKTLKDLL